MIRSCDNYDVQGIFEDLYEETIGEVELPEDAEFSDMPMEIEINGYTYHIEK